MHIKDIVILQEPSFVLVSQGYVMEKKGCKKSNTPKEKKQKHPSRKTSQPREKEKKESKKTEYEWEDYFNPLTTQMHPANNSFKLRFFSEMIQWATNDEDALHIYKYADSKGVTPDSIENWIKKDEKLKKMYEHAKRQIGYRKEIGAMKRKLDAATAHFTMPHYCTIWKAETVRRAELRQKPEEQQRPISVIIEPYETKE